MRRLAVVLAVAATLLAPTARAAQTVPTPTLTEPPAGVRGHPLWDSYYDLAPFGYEERELFVSGTARDAAGTTAPYTTRIIVTRPSNPADFNGAVFLDWVNVTAQFENAVDTMLAREMFMREGFAYVHVSAQAAGICCTPLTPEVWDPVRYAALDHPGDEFAFDMFTQIARAFEDGSVGFDVDRILAGGQSQSANQLEEYISDWLPAHPEAVGVIDGFLVHGNVPGDKEFGTGAPVPVLHLLSDFEAVDDGIDPNAVGQNYRLWEIAGAAHADYFIGYQSEFGHGPRVIGSAPKASHQRFREIIAAAGTYGERTDDPLYSVCIAAGATMPMRYAASTAIRELDDWVAGLGAPDNGPRYEFSNGQLARDADGNALGGIRLPPIDVPVAQYDSTSCQLGGVTVPFDNDELHARYQTGANYYALMKGRTDQAVADGWLLPEDAIDLMERVCNAAFQRFGGPARPCDPYVPPAFDEALPVTAPAAAPAAPLTPAPATEAARAAEPLARTGGAVPLAAALSLLALGLLGRSAKLRT
jgi:hypothetical protein